LISNVYKYITDRIVEELQKGNVPWKKPWKGLKALNYVSRKEYQGINTLLLPFPGEYLSFKQCKELGGSVKKDEKSHMIVYYKWYEKETGEFDEKGKPVVDSYPILLYHNVFHISQCEGIESRFDSELSANSNSILEQAEKVVGDYIAREDIKLNIIKGSDKASYNPIMDTIVMPDIKQFISSEEYYSALFHESVHSTGHEKRLKRIAKDKSHSYGSKEYSKEELVAEIGSTFLCNSVGIDCSTTFSNSVAYIQGWLEALKNDITLIASASTAAQKAVGCILKDNETEIVNEAR